MSELAVIHSGELSELDPYERIGTAIALAESFSDLSHVNTQLEAFRLAARRADLSRQDQNRLGFLHIQWTAKVGELRRAIPADPGGRPKKNSAPNGPSLGKAQADAEAGIGKNTGKRCEVVSEIPEQVKVEYYKEAEQKEEVVTISGLINAAKKVEKQAKKDAKIAARIAPDGFTVAGSYSLHNSSVLDAINLVEPNSVDWIITDPPYPKEFVGVFDDLAAFASHALKPGGSLVAMTGHSYLPEYIASLCRHLNYHWCCAYLTPGGQAVHVFPKKVNVFWKPLLWFVKGKYEGDTIGDVCKSDVNNNDKDHHHWGQSESGMADMINKFTRSGDLVCDPFLGGGTTAIVSLELGRRFIGFDIDASAINTTKKRIEEFSDGA